MLREGWEFLQRLSTRLRIVREPFHFRLDEERGDLEALAPRASATRRASDLEAPAALSSTTTPSHRRDSRRLLQDIGSRYVNRCTRPDSLLRAQYSANCETRMRKIPCESCPIRDSVCIASLPPEKIDEFPACGASRSTSPDRSFFTREPQPQGFTSCVTAR